MTVLGELCKEVKSCGRREEMKGMKEMERKVDEGEIKGPRSLDAKFFDCQDSIRPQ